MNERQKATHRKFLPRRPSAWLAMLCACILPGYALADMAVIVNAANSGQLDDEAIARIYLAQVKKFPDGSEAMAVEPKDNALREDFTTKLARKAPAHIKSYWAQQKFTGNLKSLKQLDTDEAVLKFVAENRNAIGYIDAAKVHGDVKVVAKY